MHRLVLDVPPQPDDRTCGPTSLHAVYAYHGDPIPLDQVIAEVAPLPTGGTLAVHLARHALDRGFGACIYTYNLDVFDPSWFAPGISLARKLEEQARVKGGERIAHATPAYLEFLAAGGEVRFRPLTARFLFDHLRREVPLLTGLSATYLYGCARERPHDDEYDDIAGEVSGHFVVLAGCEPKRRRVWVADPMHDNPGYGEPQYWVPVDRLLGAIFLGVLTYDANLLLLTPPGKPAPGGIDERERRRRGRGRAQQRRMGYPFALFSVTGVELEYMIVDRDTLSVRPIADRLIAAELGHVANDVERGPVTWSNELARHVIELKTSRPVATLDGVARDVHAELLHVEGLLEALGATLLPTAMHPWMDPARELELWPDDDEEIYRTFDRIFDCRGHGWSNLQSTHVNLPFANDRELGRLHGAIRAVLPILPALAASSPYVDGGPSGFLDTRLEVYRSNARRVASVAGLVVPEPVFDRAGYGLLARIYRDLEPLDPDGVLRHEWVNSRGCIARFDRGSVEIRTLDIQECPAADVAVVAAVVDVVEMLAADDPARLAALRAMDTAPLALVHLDCIRSGDRARITDRRFLELLGVGGDAIEAGALWRRLVERLPATGRSRRAGPALDVILDRGCLARRLVERAGREPSRGRLAEVYGEVRECLLANRSFVP